MHAERLLGKQALNFTRQNVSDVPNAEQSLHSSKREDTLRFDSILNPTSRTSGRFRGASISDILNVRDALARPTSASFPEKRRSSMPVITYSCPDCGGLLQTSFEQAPTATTCPACQSERQLRTPEMDGGYLQRCIACPSTELFVRKDFPQRLGVTIVVTGFIVSSIFYYYHNLIATFAVLLLTALIDVVLYVTMGNMLECYRCHAQYRGLPGFDDYDQFDLEAYEKHRQQALRLKEARQEKKYAESVANANDPTSKETLDGAIQSD